MPQPQKSRRVEQCVYKEDGRRCRRSATGNPALCNPHRIAVVEAARQEQAAPAGEKVYSLLEKIFTGRKVNRRAVEDAAREAAGIWDWYQTQVRQGHVQPGPVPPVDDEGAPRQNGHRWWDPLINQQRRPPPDPRIAERKAARQRARVTLGFTPTEPLSEDVLKKRQRELARKHHPDRGGSVTKMQEINAAVDVLLEELVG